MMVFPESLSVYSKLSSKMTPMSIPETCYAVTSTYNNIQYVVDRVNIPGHEITAETLKTQRQLIEFYIFYFGIHNKTGCQI